MSSPTPSNNSKKLRLNYFTQSFQLRYGIWLASIGAFCFFLMGYLIHLSIRHAIQDSPQSGTAKEALAAFLSPQRVFLSPDVLLPACILVAFLLAIGIVGTHRIAGPLFAIKRHINRVRRGSLRRPLQLRQGDELMDVAASLNALFNENWGFEKQVSTEIAEALKLIEAGRAGPAADRLHLLKALLEQRQNPKTVLPPQQTNPSIRRAA